jgi:hypothetical protein
MKMYSTSLDEMHIYKLNMNEGYVQARYEFDKMCFKIEINPLMPSVWSLVDGADA